jgi:hypothetical protein
MIDLQNVSWRIVDDVEWCSDWVGLSSGDIYRDGTPFGHYLAAWYPNLDRPLQMIITVVNESLRPTLSIGVTCPRGHIELLAPAEPDDVPWTGDGVIFMPVTAISEYAMHNSAEEALSIAKEIVRIDLALYKFVCEPTMRISQP